jgi:cation/acetate symporter
VTMPLAFVTCWLVSVLDHSEQADIDRARSAAPQERRVFAGPVSH